MKTTVDLSEELFCRATAEAALRGRRLDDMIEEGLRMVLETPRPEQVPLSLWELMKDACGVVDSGVPDLASNANHLRDFGRNSRRNR